MERRCTWRRLLLSKGGGGSGGSAGTPQHTSGTSTDTELTTLDTHELWLPESEPPPSAMSALHAFGAEMLKLSRGLEGMGSFGSSQQASITGSAGTTPSTTPKPGSTPQHQIAAPGQTPPNHHYHQHHQHYHHQHQHQATPQRRCSFRNG